jgi:hypothetical protein
VTAQDLAASQVAEARTLDRFRYLRSTKIDKEGIAREIAATRHVRTGLVCVLQCVEPCWSFDKATTADGQLYVRGMTIVLREPVAIWAHRREKGPPSPAMSMP